MRRTVYGFEHVCGATSGAPSDVGDKLYATFLLNLALDPARLDAGARALLRRYVANVHINCRWYNRGVLREKALQWVAFIVSVALLVAVPIGVNVQKLGLAGDPTALATTGLAVLVALHRALSGWIRRRRHIGPLWKARADLLDEIYTLETGWVDREEGVKIAESERATSTVGDHKPSDTKLKVQDVGKFGANGGWASVDGVAMRYGGVDAGPGMLTGVSSGNGNAIGRQIQNGAGVAPLAQRTTVVKCACGRGAAMMRVEDLEGFGDTGGWFRVGRQKIRYGGRAGYTGTGLITGIPVSGVGSISEKLAAGAEICAYVQYGLTEELRTAIEASISRARELTKNERDTFFAGYALPEVDVFEALKTGRKTAEELVDMLGAPEAKKQRKWAKEVANVDAELVALEVGIGDLKDRLEQATQERYKLGDKTSAEYTRLTKDVTALQLKITKKSDEKTEKVQARAKKLALGWQGE